MKGNVNGAAVWRAVVWIIVAMVAILSLGAFLTFKSLTLVGWWVPVTMGLVIAALSGTVLWRAWGRLTGSGAFWPNFLLNLLFITLLLTGLFYTLNAVFLSDAPPRKERVRVEEKYRERHHTSRRVGKHSYVSGPDYFEYYVTVALPDSNNCNRIPSGNLRRNIRLPYSVYRDISRDSFLTLSLRRGIFGAEVICTRDIPADNPTLSSPRKKRRCRFFGTSGRQSQ